MMHRLFTVLAAAFLGGCVPALASVPARWAVETSRARAVSFECYRGETLDLEAAFTSYGVPADFAASSVSLYWQTNGMGEVWWSAPAAVASNVVTAAFSPSNDVGAANYVCFLGSPETSYRAAFRIRMLDAPGATPNELALPAKTIDFATVSVANAPWLTAEDLAAATNTIAKTIPTVPTKVSAFTNDVGYLTTHQSLDGYATTNALAEAVADAGKVKSVNGATGDVKIAASDLGVYTKTEVDTKVSAAGKVKSVNKKTGDVTLDASDVGAATEADVNSVWGYMKGETFRVVVTNYDSAVNPPRTRYDYRMGTSNEWRTVWTETNGLAWAVSEATNLAAGAAQTMLDRPENRAWGGWDSHTGEAAPDGVVQVSGGGGLLIGSESGWTQINATGGSYWVLTSTDPTLRANGTNGVFQITDPDGKSVMTIKKGDKLLVYADAAGLTKSGDTITVKYEVISQEAPTAEVALALDGTWYEQGASGAPYAVSWSGSSGAWVMTATAPSGGTFPTTGFFRAMYETGGDTEVVYDAAIGLTKVSIGGRQYTVGKATVTDASGNTKTVLTLE